MKTNKLIYRKYIFMYGILAVLYTLRYFEEKEMFEECQKIMDAINEQNDIFNEEYVTNLEEFALKDLKVFWKNEFSDEQIKGAYNYYSKIMIDEIYEKYKD